MPRKEREGQREAPARRAEHRQRDGGAGVKVCGCALLQESPRGVGGHRQHIPKTKVSWVSLN